jgi:DNA (cytosine-5)-methyltransferase 1
MEKLTMDYSKKNCDELRAICREKKLKGYSTKKKDELVALLRSQYEVPAAAPVQNEVIVPVEEHAHNDPSKPTFIEVCAGCGGLSTGFMDAGFQPLLINEIEKTFCETLKKNHKGANIVHGSMLDLDLKPYKGKVDVLQGGVPCQAFSQAGERKGLEDPRGALIVHFNTLINDCEPKVFVVENVKGLTTHNNGETLKGVIEMFKNDGKYQVQYKVLNAVNYNVPQKRERILIVGVRADIQKEFTYPVPSEERVLLRDVLQNVPPSLGAIYPKKKADIMALVPPGGCWINLPDGVKEEYMGEKGMAAGGGKRGIARRLSMDEACLTLTTSPCQKQTERCHPTETRPLTVREYARIQTFPDSYEFMGSMANQYKQIGNAVPVQLAFAMAKRIKEFLTE